MGRESCTFCLPGATLPVDGQDEPALMERAKAGRIAQALGNRLIALDQARAAEWRAAEARRREEGGQLLSDADSEREAMLEAMTPLDADSAAEDR